MFLLWVQSRYCSPILNEFVTLVENQTATREMEISRTLATRYLLCGSLVHRRSPMAMLQIIFDNCIKQLVRWESDRGWDDAVKIEKAKGGMRRYWAHRAQPWGYLHGTPPSIDRLPRLLRLVAIEAQAYLQRRLEGRPDFTWKDVQVTYCDRKKDDGFRNMLAHRQRIMRQMLGTIDPDPRNLND